MSGLLIASNSSLESIFLKNKPLHAGDYLQQNLYIAKDMPEIDFQQNLSQAIDLKHFFTDGKIAKWQHCAKYWTAEGIVV
ncbi:hypothetical protein [Janthinobacterium sp. HLX7-2]|uniref:hypothetical protein n=1 Tax=Janthinobacterium sp. HLX7-2 TaxID=1259331 RepID=UPI003F2732B9